ncbi:hypothetical protein N1851_033170 [Merluccius polli]|uniref:Uncharacterized protein n=1 Tax=Merluccius polli TaxID=89951 RepID=A0AA47NN90_MERPO|nr:hypothetical protein N1851_033170 [Merluccius polli]
MRWVSIAEFNSSAKIKFLKDCNECLVLTAKAFVPGYEPLDYLLAYGLHPELNEYFLRPTREQASCKRLKPPPPFHYKGAEFVGAEGRERRGVSAGREFSILTAWWATLSFSLLVLALRLLILLPEGRRLKRQWVGWVESPAMLNALRDRRVL